MSEPKVSICLPVKNGGSFLRRAIDSVLNQSVKDLEVVVVDDCSEDDTGKILDELAINDERLRVTFNEQPLGFVDNFNKTLSLCRGNFIKPLLQSDLCRPNLLEAMLSVMENENNVSLVSVSRLDIGADGVEVAGANSFEKSGTFAGWAIIKLYLRELRNRTGRISQLLFRAREKSIALNPAYRFSQDTEFALRLCQFGDFAYIAEPLLLSSASQQAINIPLLPDLSFVLEQTSLVESFAPCLVEHGMPSNKIWQATIRGLIEIISNLPSTGAEFPVPAPFCHGQLPDDDPRVFVRLAGLMTRYVAGRHRLGEEALMEAKRRRLVTADENAQLLARMHELEGEIFSHKLESERANSEIESLEAEIARVKTSKSWRLTKPLRQFRRI